MAIETKEEFKAWLQTQPQNMRALIAARAAIRAFPIVLRADWSNPETEKLVLLTARLNLIAGIAAKMPYVASMDTVRAQQYKNNDYVSASGVEEDAASLAADAAMDAAYEVCVGMYSAAGACGTAANAFNLAAGAASESYAAAFADTGLDFETLLKTPVWHEPKEPDWLKQALEGRENLLESGPEWAFWRKWYQGWLTGRHLDWELQRRVALIENAIWEAGSAAVAKRIKEIQQEADEETTWLDDLVDKTQVDRPLFFDEAKNQYRLRDEPVLDDAALGFMRNDVEEALQNAFDTQTIDGFKPDCPEALAITRVHKKHANDASMLATTYFRQVNALQAKIGDVYPDEPGIKALHQTLYARMGEICDKEPDAQARVRSLAALSVQSSPNSQERIQVAETTEKLMGTENLDEELQDKLQESSENIVEQPKPSPFHLARFTNMIGFVLKHYKKAKKATAEIAWLEKTVKMLRRILTTEDRE